MSTDSSPAVSHSSASVSPSRSPLPPDSPPALSPVSDSGSDSDSESASAPSNLTNYMANNAQSPRTAGDDEFRARDSDSFSKRYPNIIVRVSLLMVVSLYAQYHLPFRACTLLLTTLKVVFEGIRAVDPVQHPIPTTLTTLLHHLNLTDQFKTYTLCQTCWHVCDPATHTGTTCPNCNQGLFHRSDRSKPILTLPIQPLSSLLSGVLNQKGIAEELEKWSSRDTDTDIYAQIQDGRVWKEGKLPNGESFFSKDEISGELRLGVTISLDW